MHFSIRHHIFKIFVDLDLLEFIENYKAFITDINFIEEAFLE